MKTTDYVSGLHYENDTLRFLQHAEGRVRFGAAGARYDYTLRDHLGNTRVLFSDTDSNGCPEALQVNDYYPFGLGHATAAQGADYQYLYNGKELQEGLGLGWYDYGARLYQPETGRWREVDLLSEKYWSISPFVYAASNPVTLVDPWGMDVYYYDEHGEFAGYVQNDKKNSIVIVNRGQYEKAVVENLKKVGTSDFKFTDQVVSESGAIQMIIDHRLTDEMQSYNKKGDQGAKREYGGFIYAGTDKVARLFVCAECETTDDLTIKLDTYNKGNIEAIHSAGGIFHTSWHTHPSGTRRRGLITEKLMSNQPSESDFDAGRTFRSTRSDQHPYLSKINGGLGLIAAQSGVLVFQHSYLEGYLDQSRQKLPSKDYRIFSYDWFHRAGGSVAFMQRLALGPAGVAEYKRTEK